MYYYYDAPATNKIVNWYGVILKIHQIILQTGLLPMLRELALNIHLFIFTLLRRLLTLIKFFVSSLHRPSDGERKCNFCDEHFRQHRWDCSYQLDYSSAFR